MPKLPQNVGLYLVQYNILVSGSWPKKAHIDVAMRARAKNVGLHTLQPILLAIAL